MRHYKERHFMRDAMSVGDGVVVYHSLCLDPGIAALPEIATTARPDDTHFDPSSPYIDTKATCDRPRWVGLEVRLRCKTRLLPLAETWQALELAAIQSPLRGNRLSITSDASEWRAVCVQLGVRAASGAPMRAGKIANMPDPVVTDLATAAARATGRTRVR